MRKACVCGLLAVAVVFTANSPLKAEGTKAEFAKLKHLVEGTWDATVVYGGSESKGTSVTKLDLGGSWLTSDFHSIFEGQKFEGKAYQTYDPVERKYVSVWLDSMGTVPDVMKGEFDADGKVLTLVGDSRTPEGKVIKMKHVTEFKNKDTMVATMTTPGPDGKETTMMTITYKRAQPPRFGPVRTGIGK